MCPTLAAWRRILGSCPEATVAALDCSEALGSLAQAIRVQQRDGLAPDLWNTEAPPEVSLCPILSCIGQTLCLMQDL